MYAISYLPPIDAVVVAVDARVELAVVTVSAGKPVEKFTCFQLSIGTYVEFVFHCSS